MQLLTTQGGLPRVSWGAVIAGVILSLIVYLILSVLGTAIGASLLSPMSRPNPLQGFGFGSGVWVIVTTVTAVFIGSYFGRPLRSRTGLATRVAGLGRNGFVGRLWNDIDRWWCRQR